MVAGSCICHVACSGDTTNFENDVISNRQRALTPQRLARHLHLRPPLPCGMIMDTESFVAAVPSIDSAAPRLVAIVLTVAPSSIAPVNRCGIGIYRNRHSIIVQVDNQISDIGSNGVTLSCSSSPESHRCFDSGNLNCVINGKVNRATDEFVRIDSEAPTVLLP